ncbi:hypothetical protein N4G70_35870 [Streptomyces sp. ASQP_92]|nr:hypothetical protein [Streptomyces sp. ASQP_92]MCT9094180.1 hypothetical protein [Streptomyces sp. ASQP_92]
MPSQDQRTVLEAFPAGHPRGSWPAEEYAAVQRAQGMQAQVVMDLRTDQFLVVTRHHHPLIHFTEGCT